MKQLQQKKSLNPIRLKFCALFAEAATYATYKQKELKISILNINNLVQNFPHLETSHLINGKKVTKDGIYMLLRKRF